MKLQLPFAYEVSVQLPRNRRPVRRLLCRMFDMDIPEVSDAEAPVAARWLQRGTLTKAGEHHDVQARMEVRHHDGNFYRPLVCDHFDMKAATSLETLSGYATVSAANELHGVFCRDLRTQPISKAMQLIAHGHGRIVDNGERLARGAEVIESKLDDTLHDLDEALSDYVLIDGGLWHKVSEPVIVFDTVHYVASITTGKPGYGARCLARRGRLTIGGARETRMFRIDQFDDMQAAVQDWEAARGSHNVTELEIKEVEVLRPETLAFEPEINQIHRQLVECWRLAMFVDNEALSALHREAGAHLRSYDTDGGTAHLADAVSAVMRLHEAIGDRVTEAQAKRLAVLADLQDSLPVSLDFGSAFATAIVS